MNLVPVIGLEVHAQLKTRTKMFCGCPADYGRPPNTLTCPVCLGLPGALPVPNRRAVEMAVLLGLAVGAEIRPLSVFARKNYFYPDLPKGYQISQYEEPICRGGAVAIDAEEGERRVALERIHLEEDTGKSIHAEDGATWVDLNRSGVPLLEIVSRPEIADPAEARRYLEALKILLEYLRICDGNMEEGSLRCDANVSLREPDGPLGTKTEIKNLNSMRFVERALRAEIERQRERLESGGTVVQETLLFDERRGTVHPMRSKEESHDYRYFPEPDLPPLVVDEDCLERGRAELPELPEARGRRFRQEYRLPAHDAALLTATRELADYFEEAARLSGQPKKAANLVMTEVLRVVNETGASIADLPVRPEGIAELLALLDEGVVSSKIAKEVFAEMEKTGELPRSIIERKGWAQLSDSGALRITIRGVIAAHPSSAEDYRAGKEKALQFLVGQVMKATRGQANPGLANRLLREELTGPGE